MARHEAHMLRALELARGGWGRVAPNPLVGAVVVDPGGSVIGEGWHEGPGTDHAEVVALRQAGERARGATLVVTLEPCDHTGRTGPCTREIIRAGIARVVAATGDPNPRVDGAGFARLRDAGIQLEQGLLAEPARRLNVAFERHVTTGRPFVILKSAASLDGKTAAADGSSRWITSEAARADAQQLRAWSDAVIVGSGTALADDPSLTVRDPRFVAACPPLRVVVDSTGRVPATRAVFDRAAPTLVATTDRADVSAIDAWTQAGAEVLVLDRDGDGRVRLPSLVDALGERDVQGVVIEGGATLAWSAVRDDLLDRVVLYMAPSIVGGAEAPGVVMGAGVTSINDALPLAFTAIQRVGPDLKVEADVHRDHRRAG